VAELLVLGDDELAPQPASARATAVSAAPAYSSGRRRIRRA
jgi:hypothetical protein